MQPTDTSTTAILRQEPNLGAHAGGACLVHIYPTGPDLGKRYLLGEAPLVMGRGDDCGIHIRHQSVSRRHARIEPAAGTYWVIDLGSTNGVFINDKPERLARLKDGDYLRVGGCIYRFLTGGNVEAQYHEEIHRLVILDGLTGLHNRRSLEEFLDRELSRSARYDRSLALILFDIDFFKQINDRHGHLAGDAVLQELSARVRQTVRKEEMLARYGGEEFALGLVECSRAVALDVAERIRSRVAETPFRYKDKELAVTVSLGVTVASGEEGLSVADLLQRADESLYKAKEQGRNRVVG